MHNFDLITRNTEEIVTEQELIELIETKKQATAYTGYEPSGKIHLGHLITVNKLLDLQKSGFKVKILIADIHAYLNEKGTMDEIKNMAEYNKKCFIALGLDKNKTDFVFGSSYQLESEYMMDVLKLMRITTLNRAKRSMDEVSRDAKNPKVSQMAYPLMQALDIAYLKVDIAVGGIDQRKIHMLARESLPELGFKTPICIHTPILPGLDAQKMSSSKGNYISIDDTTEDIKKKIKKAFCPEGVTNNNPVLSMFKYHIFPRFQEIIIKRPEKFGGNLEYVNYESLESDFAAKKIHPLDLKNAASDYINTILEPAREVMKN